MRSSAWLLAAALCSACATVSSSAYVPARPGASSAPTPASASATDAVSVVAVRLTNDPADAAEIAVVEAHAPAWFGTGRDVSSGKIASGPRGGPTLQALVEELKRRTASVGGDVARVDTFATKYDVVRESYSYDCSETKTEMVTKTTTEPRTKTRTDCTPASSFGGSIGGGCRTTTDTEWVTVTKTEPETKRVQKTCTGLRDVEAGVITLTGRAFRTSGAKP